MFSRSPMPGLRQMNAALAQALATSVEEFADKSSAMLKNLLSIVKLRKL